MKYFTHRVVLTTVISGTALFGVAALGVDAAAAEPLPILQQEAALNLPGTSRAADATIGLQQVVRVPTPAEINPVSTGGRASSIVPPMEISAAEARQWISDAGYSDVSDLTLATTIAGVPVYRGTAMADGKSYAVIVDSWGNIAGWQ